MNLAHYSVVDPVRSDPEFFDLVRCGITFLDPRPEPDATILSGQLLKVFFSHKKCHKGLFTNLGSL